jgi:diaminopimelate epimerase
VNGSGPRYVKGHGTENDFVVILDPQDSWQMSEQQVRALCDRRRGLGADGVLRAVRTGDKWFMDYHNADGSIAEMCGNGARLFAYVLRAEGLIDDDAFAIGTRGGERQVRIDGECVSVSMGSATTSDSGAVVSVGEHQWDAVPVWVPNPHAVVFVADLRDAGSLSVPPNVTPLAVYPDGVNVEFVVSRAEDHIAMRVHERGVGETRSCGTGAVAAAWAWRRRTPNSPNVVRVDVPGGSLTVTEHDDGQLDLTGPVVVVGRGTIDQTWWKENA